MLTRRRGTRRAAHRGAWVAMAAGLIGATVVIAAVALRPSAVDGGTGDDPGASIAAPWLSPVPLPGSPSPDATAQTSPPPPDAAPQQADPVPAWPNAIPLPEGADADDLYAAKLTYSLVSVPTSAVPALRAATEGSEIVISARADTTDFAVPNSRVDAVRTALPDVPVRPNAPSSPPAGDQSPTPSWGLDAVDSEFAQQNNHYVYDTTGQGVTAYVIDTGLRMDHPDFSGRVLDGIDYMHDGYGTWDCWGHGTHVTGTIGGTTYGVAKSVQVMPLRVWSCKGSNLGSNMDNYAALNWVLDNRSPQRAVINMSFTMPLWPEFDDAVRRGVAAGFIIVESAGNDSSDACQFSAARDRQAIIVGATASGASFASWSNRGSCVDVLAPGNWIVSDSWPKMTASMYGTSMSAPHVSGLAARLLEIHPDWHNADILAFFSRTGAWNRISRVPAGTPNLFANIPPWPRVLSAAATTGADGAVTVSWTVNAFGSPASFAVTVTDVQTGASSVVTVNGSQRSTVLPPQTPGHSFTASVGGTGTVGNQTVAMDAVSTSFSVAAPAARVVSVTATATGNGATTLSWTVDGGTPTVFQITVVDAQTGVSYPVTVAGSRKSTTFTFVTAGHDYSVSVGGTAIAGGRTVQMAAATTTFRGG